MSSLRPVGKSSETKTISQIDAALADMDVAMKALNEAKRFYEEGDIEQGVMMIKSFMMVSGMVRSIRIMQQAAQDK